MASVGRPKSAINIKQYETGEVIRKFEGVRRALIDSGPPEDGPSLTAKSLAQLTADLIWFQEKALGKDVRLSLRAPTL